MSDQPEVLKELRCKECNSLLMKGTPAGRIEIKCKKCKTILRVTPQVKLEWIKPQNGVN